MGKTAKLQSLDDISSMEANTFIDFNFFSLFFPLFLNIDQTMPANQGMGGNQQHGAMSGVPPNYNNGPQPPVGQPRMYFIPIL